MTSEEMKDKCIALMRKLGVWEDEDKLIAWCKEYAVTTDPDTDELVVHKRSEFKTDNVIVLCAVFDPFMPMREGSTIQLCHDCQIPIVVSHDSPVKSPKVCRDCALSRGNKGEGTIAE